jgi:hypothetical protein
MHFLVLIALAASVYLSMVTDPELARVDHPDAADDAHLQVDLYREFIYVGNIYMTQHAPSVPANLIVDWPTIRASAPAPLRDAPMPPSWKIVRAADMRWAACTDMDEAAANSISVLIDPGNPAASANTPVNAQANGRTQAFVVVGDAGAAQQWASLCQ